MNNHETHNAVIDAYNVVRSIAFVYANGKIYGVDHKVTQQSADDALKLLRLFHQRHGDLHLTVDSTDFYFAGTLLGPPLSTINDLVKCLNALHAQTLILQKGVSDKEVHAFMGLLFTKPDKISGESGFAALMNAAGLNNIRAAQYSYRRVTDDQVVVDKTEAAASRAPEPTAVAFAGLFEKGVPAPDLQAAIKNVNLDNRQVVTQITKLAAPPPDADLRGAAALTDETIERLQHMSDNLLQEPANRTLKRRKTIKKIIKDVEAGIAARLQRLGADIQAVETLAARVKAMVEELTIGGLVAQYMKLQVEMAQKEKRLKRHISGAKRRGVSVDDTRERLASLGLPEEALTSLTHAAMGPKSGKGRGLGTKAGVKNTVAFPGPDEAKTADGKATNQLGSLLKKLQKTVPGDGTLPNLVEKILDEMNKTLESAATRASEQIESLRQITMIPAGRSDNADLSRRQVLELMAELGQEMRQPLTVVMGAMDIVTKNYLGHLPTEQAPMVQMATESATVLASLIDRMVKIAGMPASLTPDETIIQRLKTGDAR